jgi:hypothetical protein
MGILTTQLVQVYFDRFKNTEVTFTKEMIQATGLIAEQVHMKCATDFWPCVFYSTSFQGAKIVANIKSGLPEKLKQSNNMASVRLCFKSIEDGNPVTFFVAGKVTATVPYKDSGDVSLFTIQYTQRPPDYLIEIVGRVLDANINFSKRKDEKIILTTESRRKFKLPTRETVVFIQNVPRRCLLRELSYSNAKVIMMGVAKFLVGKETAVRLDFEEPGESILIKGKITDSEDVEGKKEMLVLNLEFDVAQIPTGYKMRVNEYLMATRLDRVPGDNL